MSQLVADTSGLHQVSQMPFRAEPRAACTDLYNTDLQHNTDLSHNTALSHKTDLSQETAQGKVTGNSAATQAAC